MDLLVGSQRFHCMIFVVLVTLFEFLYLFPTFQLSIDKSVITKHTIFNKFTILIWVSEYTQYDYTCLSFSLRV